MNRKLLLFAGVLFLLIALKYAFGQVGQEGAEAVAWEPATYEDPAETIFSLMLAAPILGAVFGMLRILAQRSERPIVQPIHLN